MGPAAGGGDPHGPPCPRCWCAAHMVAGDRNDTPGAPVREFLERHLPARPRAA